MAQKTFDKLMCISLARRQEMNATQLEIQNLDKEQVSKLEKLIKSKDGWKLACVEDTPIRVYGTHPAWVVFSGMAIVDDISQVLDIIGGDSDGKNA